MENFLKELVTTETGQSVVEYAVLFVVVVVVLIFAIIGTNFNGPVSSSLNVVFTRVIDDVSSSLNNLVNGSS